MRPLPLLAAAVTLFWAPPATSAAAREVEVGAEDLYYATAETPLNRDNVLGLDEHENLLRASLGWKESVGGLRAALRGYVERTSGADARTSLTLRQAYVQRDWGSAVSLRLGKQRVGWGSGFAWNPTSRLEPPKNPLNTGLEQAGSLGARAQWVPTSWADVILVAVRVGEGGGDLPFEVASPSRTGAGLRARFLLADTDVAVVGSGGDGLRPLAGLDLARDLGPFSAHVESALYRGSEIAPARPDRTFFRAAVGLLRTRNTATVSLEYFFNGEGYDDRELAVFLGGLETLHARSQDPRLGEGARDAALRAYLAAAAVPFVGGLGLRRHYLQASWTRSEIAGRWTLIARALLGLSDGGSAWTPGVSFAPSGRVTLHLDGVVLLGPSDSEYALVPVRRALQARVRVLF
jgi:hypothetical protein